MTTHLTTEKNSTYANLKVKDLSQANLVDTIIYEFEDPFDCNYRMPNLLFKGNLKILMQNYTSLIEQSAVPNLKYNCLWPSQ